MQQTAMAVTLPPLRTQAVLHHTNPTLLFPRRLIAASFYDACQTYRGQPTQMAEIAVDWLTARLDYSHAAIIPPPELRSEFVGSFEWACSWLGVRPDRILAFGLPASTIDSRPIYGLPEVFEIRRRAAARWRRLHA